MTKTLNQFLEGYLKVKSSDEQKFIDKHVAVANPDRNGNGDDVFKGAKVKTINRRKERKGYDAGDDAKVYEEAEQIDELSKETMKSHRRKSQADLKKSNDELESSAKKRGVSTETEYDAPHMAGLRQRQYKRYRGLDMVHGKLAKEEADLEEKAPPGAKYERMVKDIKKGYAKDGLTAREKAISYATAWKAKKANEEAELDEMRKDPETPAFDPARSGPGALAKSITKKRMARTSANLFNKVMDKHAKYSKANEEAEQVDELSQELLKKYDDLNRTSRRDLAYNKIGMIVHQKTPEQEKHSKKLKSRVQMGYLASKKAYPNVYKGKDAAKVPGTQKEETLVDLLSGLKESHIRTMVEVYESLNEENQAKFVATCKKDGGIDAMLNFAIKNRGE